MMAEYEGLVDAEAVAHCQTVLAIPLPDVQADAFPEAGACPVCFGEHDDDIHSATLSVRRWFRDQVTLGLCPVC